MVGHYYDAIPAGTPSRLLSAVQQALQEVQGTFGLAVIHQDSPEELVGARRGSPLILGIGKEGNFFSSDVTAIAGHVNQVVYLNDGDIACLTPGSFAITSLSGTAPQYEISEVDPIEAQSELGAYSHYMLKEIFEQPQALREAFRGRLDVAGSTAKLGGLSVLSEAELRDVERIVIVGCGTARHAALVGEYLIESLAGIPVEVDFASEFRYRNPPMDRKTLFFAVSQSGETADTLAALREAKNKGFRVFGICNRVGSSIARETNGGVYMHAGPEIGVAATKSFTSQVMIFTLLALFLGRRRRLSEVQGKEMIEAIEHLPGLVSRVLEQSDAVRDIAERYQSVQSMIFLGRLQQYPVALEGALKMKEITYIKAEGHPSAELKHGIIALIDEATPAVLICTQDDVYDKNVSSLQEIKARNGSVIAVASEGDEGIASMADEVLYIPKAPAFLQPILASVLLQLLAYHTAAALGRDIDKPRNLAKSVTVE